MFKKPISVFIILFITCFSSLLLYFELNKPEPGPQLNFQSEITAISIILGEYQQADLKYRMGHDLDSADEAKAHIAKALLLSEEALQRINAVPEENSRLIFQQILATHESINHALTAYQGILSQFDDRSSRKLPEKVLQLYNKVLSSIDVLIANLAEEEKKEVHFTETNLVLLLKELLLATYKLDSFENRQQIYLKIAEVTRSDVVQGTGTIIGNRIDEQLNLYFHVRMPQHKLFDTIFSDLEMKIPIWGLILPTTTELSMIKNYIKRIETKFIKGKQLTFLGLEAKAPDANPNTIVILENGISLQEQIVQLGIAKPDLSLANVPIKWQGINKTARELRLGIYQ